jgi:EAL domain-containing protein (putative c-di-GMP-specific phosphodiesterase class I)
MSPVANNALGELDSNALRKLLRRVDALLPASPSFRVLAGKGIVGKFYGATISSHFQTLLDPASGAVIGHEALARSNSANDSGQSPWGLFADSASDEHLIALDRLCRTIHALNFRASGLSASGGTLLLEVHERLLHAVPHGHGSFFRQVLELIGIPPARIIIDIPPLQSSDVHWLRRVVGSYQSAGFGVAIAVTSALQAKLYATLLRPQWIRLPPELVHSESVRALHALKVNVIAAGVDHASTCARALSTGQDMLQGLHYAPPAVAA